MAALAEVMERLAGDIRLVDRERLDDDSSSAKEHIALTDGIRSDLGFDNDGEFKEIRGANCATVRIMNDACVKAASGSPKKIAVRAEVSTITWAGRVHHKGIGRGPGKDA